jgi:hypothetical protein
MGGAGPSPNYGRRLEDGGRTLSRAAGKESRRESRRDQRDSDRQAGRTDQPDTTTAQIGLPGETRRKGPFLPLRAQRRRRARCMKARIRGDLAGCSREKKANQQRQEIPLRGASG